MAHDAQLGDRRPIASREHRVWKATAAWLAARGVSPNAISAAGMVACIVAGTALCATSIDGMPKRLLWLSVAVLIQFRLIANMLDGMVALHSGKSSAVGELYNEVPDRVSDAATLIGLGYAAGGSPPMGYVAALLAVFVAYVRVEGRVAGAPQFYIGPMAKPHRMFIVTLLAIVMAAMPEPWLPRLGPDGHWGLPALAVAIIAVGCCVTAWRRLCRISAALKEGDRA